MVLPAFTYILPIDHVVARQAARRGPTPGLRDPLTPHWFVHGAAVVAQHQKAFPYRGSLVALGFLPKKTKLIGAVEADDRFHWVMSYLNII